MSLALDWVRRQRAAQAPRATPAAAPRRPEFGAAPSRQPSVGHPPGEEIAPGLWLAQHWRALPHLPARIDLAALGHGEVDAGRLAFFDTETTGLAGGTGTRAFMIGLGLAGPEGLHLRQWTLGRLGAEPALLDAFVAALPADAVLVSYNGRSYDRPLLSTRLRLARREDPLRAMAHLDLLHPARRRWRGVLPNCRLATVEREILGIVREDDLPGSEAPAAFRAFLRGGSARLLHRVAAHNAQDLATLAQLLVQLSTSPVDKPWDRLGTRPSTSLPHKAVKPVC